MTMVLFKKGKLAVGTNSESVVLAIQISSVSVVDIVCAMLEQSIA